MPLAIFGISNDGLNLAANLFVLMLVAVWIALIAWTYMDARRRIEDPVIIACATLGSLMPYIGTAVYAILRPPEFLDDARERDLEMRAAELRVRQLSEMSCPNCGYPVEKNYLRCPDCQRRLKDPCQNCGKPVDPRWALCPYCETQLPGRTRPPARPPEGRKAPTAGKRPPQRATRSGRKESAAPRKEPTRAAKPDGSRPGRREQAPPSRERQGAGGSRRQTATVREAEGGTSGNGERSSGDEE
jgi:hypothetical protein